MIKLIEAAQQALEALRYYRNTLEDDQETIASVAIDALRAALSEEAMQRLTDVQQEMEPVAYRLHETDIYDFAGWLTTRPGTMKVGSACEAGPITEAVGEYLQTFPERFFQSTPQQATPVAWMVYTLDGKSVCVTDNPADFTDQHKALPLYTTPPKREWIGLTDEELRECAQAMDAEPLAEGWKELNKFARAIEAKLKEKNS